MNTNPFVAKTGTAGGTNTFLFGGATGFGKPAATVPTDPVSRYTEIINKYKQANEELTNLLRNPETAQQHRRIDELMRHLTTVCPLSLPSSFLQLSRGMQKCRLLNRCKDIKLNNFKKPLNLKRIISQE